MSSTRSPSEMPPPAGMRTPRTVFSPLSCAFGLKTNVPFFVRLSDRPTREAASYLLHVFLRISTIDAERM